VSDAVKSLVDSLNKKFGLGSAFTMSSMPETGITNWIPAGSAVINSAIGRPGIPQGKVTTVIGPPSAGKTTLVTHIMTECQKMGGVVVYINAERSYDPERAKRIGLDIDNVIVVQPETVEDAFEITFNTAMSIPKGCKIPYLVAWDTFSASPTSAELFGSGDAGKKNIKAGTIDTEVNAHQGEVAGHSRIVSGQMRRLQGPMDDKNLTFLVVLQSKEDIGVQWGSGLTYLAKKPWFFYSNVQMEVKRIGNVTEGDRVVGIRSEVHISKNKVGKPFGKVQVDCLFHNGFDNFGPLLELAAQKGIIKVKGGGWMEISREGKPTKNFLKKDWQDIYKEYNLGELLK